MPIRFARGWGCFWFYTATAFCRATIWALAMIFVFCLLENKFGQQMKMEQVEAELATLSVALGLTTLMGIVAVIWAVRRGLRVWVHPNVREQCGGDFQRLGYIRGHYLGNPMLFYYGMNHAILVLAVSLVLPTLIIAIGLMSMLTFGGPPNAPFGFVDGLAMLLVLGPTFATIPFYAALGHRIIARTPSECWPPSM